MCSVRDDGDVCARAEGDGGDPFAGHTRPRAGLEYSIGDAFGPKEVACERGVCGPAVTVHDGGEGMWAKIIAIVAGPDMKTAHANARLFAAAPALLAERDKLRAEVERLRTTIRLADAELATYAAFGNRDRLGHIGFVLRDALAEGGAA